MRELFDGAHLAAEDAAQRPVHEGVDEHRLMQALREAFSLKVPTSIERYAAFMKNMVVGQSIDMSHPRCLAHMSGHPPPFMHELADFMGRLNQNMVKADGSRMLSLIERQVLAMLHQLVFGDDRDPLCATATSRSMGLAHGLFTSGGTLANLAGLWVARARAFAARGAFAGVEHAGLDAALAEYGHTGVVVIGSELMHYSIDKAAAMLGLGKTAVLKVRVDHRLRLDPRHLDKTLRDCADRGLKVMALIGVAGTTDACSVDPLAAMAELALEHGIHFHVDAAVGLTMLCSHRHRSKLEGVGQADSIAMDCHKQWLMPIGSGVLLLRNPRLAQTLTQTAPYMLHAASADLGKFSLEGSRSAGSLLLHAALSVFGREGIEALVDFNHDMAQRFAAMIESSQDFELLHPPEGTVVLYRYVPSHLRRTVDGCHKGRWSGEELNELNRVCSHLQQRQYQGGLSHVSMTSLTCLPGYAGVPVNALRAVFNNPAIHTADLVAVLNDQRAVVRSMTGLQGA